MRAIEPSGGPGKWLASAILLLAFFCAPLMRAQSLGAGTLKGSVTDASGAAIPLASVELSNRITGFSRQIRTSPDGSFSLEDVPQNIYTLTVKREGFEPSAQTITIRTTVSVETTIQLRVAEQQTAVTVEAESATLVENVAVASHTVDQLTIASLPSLSPASGLNDAITFTTPNVAADSNGFFHPLGDHAQVSYVIDGQPISDQRNKVFSTAIPANAIQSMEVVSGSPAAEYGDKTSLVVNANTRSGLGQKTSGSFLAHYGSFGTVGEEATLGVGGARWGNFLVLNSERTGRFLDTPEFSPMHDVGNTGTFFDRVDFQPTAKDSFHLDLLSARNWMQIPNTYDQPNQDQKQKVVSFNIAPGYQHTVNSRTLLTANAFFRRDQVEYYPTRNAFDDSPATLGQRRSLANYGIHTDVSHAAGRHNLKVGLNAVRTNLNESFSLGVTDPVYNSPCLSAARPASLTAVAQCAAAGLPSNPDFLPGLLPYDLTRGGALYRFRGSAAISQVAWFGQDTITVGNLTLNIGLRYDYYNGLTRGSGPQPRGAFSWLLKPTKTVIRGGYSHTLETPVNENLVVSRSTGAGGLASNLLRGAAQQLPIGLGSRNQYDAGIQQSIGRWALIDVSYFRKYTRNAFDFDALFSTPITFPIGWKQSKLDGVGARITTPDIHGLRMYATMGHANARFFGPENGGIIFNSSLAIGAYRQDHDQVYQQNVNIHYRPVFNAHKSNWWADFTWRYDSGLVVGAINNLADALALTAAQQSAIGLYCGNQQASLTNRITSCNLPGYGAQRINILASGAENDDHNPPRTKPRNIFDLGLGNDNVFKKEHVRTVLRFTGVNLSNEASLYNFLSPFSGTHWFQPRSFQAQLGWAF